MAEGTTVSLFLLSLWCSASVTTAVQRSDIFPYGTPSGDLTLAEGDDETSKVLTLPRPLYFYNTQFSELYVATNGIISAQDLPMEKQYVDDGFPTDFPVVAPFLADLDTSGGRGQIYYRLTETPSVLNRVSQEVHRGFPDARFTPTHTVVATWENVGAYEEQSRQAGPTNQVNTFQAVIAYDETDSYALFLYPEDGLHFFGTRPKESYNVEIELPARVGFSRGEITYFLFSRQEGPHYGVTSDQQSVKNLYQVGNTGSPGVWLFHIGNSYSFDNIVPAAVSGLLAHPRPEGYDDIKDTTTPEYGEFEEYPDSNIDPENEEEEEEEEEDYPVTTGDPEFQPPGGADRTPESPLEPERRDPAPYYPPEENAEPENHGRRADTTLTYEPRYVPEHGGRQYQTPPPRPPPETYPEGGPLRPGEPQPQCHRSAGQCWCVDSRGQERADTRTAPGTPPTDCDEAEEPERPKTHCQHHRDRVQTTSPEGHPLLGVYVPDCDEAGQYKTQQCHVSTGYCWCVDSQGQERANTRTSPRESPVDCNKPDEPERPKTRCEQHRESLQTTGPEGHPIAGASAPRCDARGEYAPLQCHGSTGHCWCVDIWGHEREGTRSLPGTPATDCDKPDEPERPKTHCQHHRDGVQTTSPEGYPLVGAFVPECDEHGQYKPLQCHGSTGHCWCVDNGGQERQGTRTSAGTPNTDCSRPDEPERPKTHCQHHRDGVQTTSPEGYPLVGAFVPECDEHGQYKPLQCHGSTGHCWCVDNGGQERQGTRTSAGTPNTDCSRPDEPERPKTRCERHRDSVVTTSPEGYPITGAFVPECVEHGQYRPLQCHGSTGYCWCVDGKGQERGGTRSPPGTPTVDCNKPDEPERPKTHCQHHRDGVQTTSPEGYPLLGAFVPECDAYGQYKPLQCHGSTGHCWCVDDRGQERVGTRTPAGTPTIDCDKPVEPELPKTHCQHHRDSVQTTSPEGYSILGAFVPQCDANGQYVPLQCHGSTGHCWCVDNAGQERARSRTPPGTPPKDCDKPDEPERPKTHCEQHRYSTTREGPAPGAFVPDCDEDGQYRPQQCHGSTGHCWCVDQQGQERAGTRTASGTPPRDCYKPDEPERPKTPCQHHRDGIQTTSPEGHPLLGAFVPECDAEGQYKTHQCHGSTGHCWCVDNRGQERAGTRTPAGSPKKDCNKPDHEAPRPESVCERWRASLVEHYGGTPEPQHYLPQCDAHGNFSPVQCYGDTSYCWCVDQDGREIEGTRSHNVVKPACLSTVAPPTMRPLPRPDVTPPPSDITLLYAQGQQIGALPLNGTRLDPTRAKTLLALHGSIVVGVAYDCQENKVYWSDLSGRTISRASLTHGAEPEVLINTDLASPEGLAVDPSRRLMFWVDSAPDKIERANLDGSGRRTLFHRDLVNPRAIIVVPSTGTLYWTDWNREAPKIECSTVDGDNRKVVVSEGIGLPNALTYDTEARQICWADAGTKKLECVSPDGSGRRVIHPNLNYPFSMVYYRNHFYYSDWRRDGVIAVNKDTSKFTDEFLPDQRSHLYGLTIATTNCLSGSH
ncbi:nidogen-2 [Gadus chalcogrammus]|uniref:nidogen-2 n=1 Tax=Gadus chalcogrammus TaxID=1042646 RepID=UPI0024C43EF6|nr:nidogen-2 [Gadus chalcogrammus]